MHDVSYADGSSRDDRYHTSGEIRRQLKLKKFGNAIVDISSPHHRLDNRREIIVGENNIRRLLGHVRALNALKKRGEKLLFNPPLSNVIRLRYHSEAHVGAFECRSIVRAVAGDGHHLTMFCGTTFDDAID